MKKILWSLSVAAVFTAFTACKKEEKKEEPYKCTTCTTTPEAKAANDASSKGIYKGVIIGSSGTIKFDIANNGSAITAVMVIDGTTVNLGANVTWTNGQAYVAPFTGTLNGQPVTINFSVEFNGADPLITSANIPGHPNAVFTLVKETSTSLIEAFEGTYTTTKPKNGTFNILVARSLKLWGGVARENGSQDEDHIKGTLTDSGKIIGDTGVEMGTLSGDQISGQFKDSGNFTVTITGKRTL